MMIIIYRDLFWKKSDFYRMKKYNNNITEVEIIGKII